MAKSTWRLTTGLLLMTVACVGFAWLGEQNHAAARERKAVAALAERHCILIPNEKSAGDRLLELILGDEALSRCGYCEASSEVTDDDLVHLQDLRELTSLYLSGSGITDQGMKDVGRVQALSDLWLDQTSVTDYGIWELRELKQLSRLKLSASSVTESGVDRLQRALPNLSVVRSD